jgi:hypothetical protein
MTRWSAQVTPQNVWREYPRPQMVRQEWVNLNGLWEYSIQPKSETPPLRYSGMILVPFPVESALSGVKHILQPDERLWYRRTFDALKLRNGERLLLHFGAVDWQATVYVNGRKLGVHDGGYDSFTFDITPYLKPAGRQALTVEVFDPTDAGGQPRGRQTLYPERKFYTGSSGIWQTVWLEVVPAEYISHLSFTPDVDFRTLHITVNLSGRISANVTALASARSGGRIVGKCNGHPGSRMNLIVSNPHLWSPDDPFLYQLDISLLRGGTAIDHVSSYFALRKVSCESDGRYPRIMINGKFLFESGVLDQGFWPDGLYTAPTDSAMRNDLYTMKRLGYNLIRKHLKVEPERWYYWADKLGILVWQDMPLASNQTPEDRNEFEAELHRMIAGRGNHPSIIMWIVFNEGGGQFDTQRLAQKVHEWDPNRLVDESSGWNDEGAGDVMDIHQDSRPVGPLPKDSRAVVVGEYGGMGLSGKDHPWVKQNKSGSDAGSVNGKEYTNQLVHWIRMARYCAQKYGLCGAVYRQLSDVELETNGLLTNDRAILRPDVAQTRQANLGPLNVNADPKLVVPTSEDYPALWYYTFTKPNPYWIQPDFDEEGWRQGFAGFGAGYSEADTLWDSADIWMRRWVQIPDNTPQNLAFLVMHDGDVEIYINGVKAASAAGLVEKYTLLPMNLAGRYALRPGKNLIAVHCHQATGGQFIDMGIVAVSK